MKNLLYCLLILLLPGTANAYECYGDNVQRHDVLAGTVNVNLRLPPGSLIWASQQYRRSVLCTFGTVGGSVYFYVDPENTNRTLHGVEVGILYNGQIYTSGKVPIANVKFNVLGIAQFTLDYAVVIIRKPGSLIGHLPTFHRVFNISGAILNGIGFVNYSNVLKVTFNPVEPTCSLDAGDKKKIVRLKTISPRDLPAAGASTGRTSFMLKADCSDAVDTVTFKFTGPGDKDNSKLFSNLGTARGVAIHLGSTRDQQTIGAGGSNATRTALIINRTATLDLFAEYKSTRLSISAGTVSSNVTVQISYE